MSNEYQMKVELGMFIMKKTKTYMDKLMENKEFREKFDKKYQNLCIGEHIAKIRHQAILIQDTLIKQAKIVSCRY